MKKLTIILFTGLLSSCINVKQIGKVNMISNRNIDPNLKYSVITTYSGGSNRELTKSRATTIEDAIDQTVKKIPGGEFLMNAKIYIVGHGGGDTYYFAVEGDIWGIPTVQSYRGFKVGDRVTWKKFGKFYSGIITALKDDKTCYIKDSSSGETVEKIYDDITIDSLNSNTTTPTKEITTPPPPIKSQTESEDPLTIGDTVMWQRAMTSTYDKGIIISIKDDFAVIQYKDQYGKEKIKQVLKSKLTKVQ